MEGAEPVYRLITTLLDAEDYPADELAALYPERWEVEAALDEFKTHMRGGQVVLRSKTPELVPQEFCVEAYQEALGVAGRSPGIMNYRRFAPPFGQPAAGFLPAVGSDQGSQFTSEQWIEAVEASGARVSMDGKGRWMDKRMAAPGLHRAALAQPKVRGSAALELRDGDGGHCQNRKWMAFYNHRRKLQTLDYQVPWSRYRPEPAEEPRT